VAPDGTWSVPSLDVGASETLTVTLTADHSTAAGTDVISDTASVTSADQQIVNTGDDMASASTSVITKTDLQLMKSGSPMQVLRGKNITYTIDLTNAGPSDAQTVTITDVLPAQTTFVSAVGPAGWTGVTPAVGAPGTVSFSKSTVAAAEMGAFT